MGMREAMIPRHTPRAIIERAARGRIVLFAQVIAALWCDCMYALERAWIKQSDDGGNSKLDAMLRRRLRCYPYWCNGHLKLGAHAAACGDPRLAHASAHAALACSRSARQGRQARWIMAKSHLLTGNAIEAEKILLPLLEEALPLATACAVREDTAAALSLRGDFAGAWRQLDIIPAGMLSREGVAAKDFLSAKISAGFSP